MKPSKHSKPRKRLIPSAAETLSKPGDLSFGTERRKMLQIDPALFQQLLKASMKLSK